AVLALLAAPLAAHEEDGGMNMEVVPVLTVSGSGQARVTPDEATVRLGVTAQAPTARAAQEQVNRVANAILAAVRTLGVEAKDIQTSDLSLNPVYSQGRGQELQEPRITGYQASNVVSIRLEDLTKVGPVIDVGLSSGANRLEGVFFGLRNDQAARAEALTDAVREARSKAEALARALRVRLLEIIEVAEGGVTISPPPTPFRGRVAMAEMAMDSSTPVSAGEVGVEASVTLRYRIAPCAEGQPCP
ncbi:MAG TPA: SIMPL domain-containing protein, partial [Thermoanaerobaculia bacterium]|nr:SIMPL domain-containing protein [Thermoanaerobaculia bacterium]